VSTPSAPWIIGTVDTPGMARGVAVANGYAYVADNTAVQVIDVRTPSSPRIVGSLATTASSAVAMVGTRLYVIDGLQLKIIDVVTPGAPVLLSTSDALGAQAIDAVGALVFLATPAATHADPTGGLSVIDVSDGFRPRLVEHLVVPGITRTVAATTN